MRPIKPYVAGDYDFSHEISQAENLNANARLWIQPNGTVLKLYTRQDAPTRANIAVLRAIAELDALYALPQIAMPLHLLGDGERIVGYTMPYCEGVRWHVFMRDPQVAPALKRGCFARLAALINAMPDGVFIGDLHGGNVLVREDGGISLIDVDGFSLNGLTQTCPLTAYAQRRDLLGRGKYLDGQGELRVSRDTDLFCLMRLFLQWVSGGVDLLTFTRREIDRYLRHLRRAGFPPEILRMMHRLFASPHNAVNPGAFNQLDLSRLDSYAYAAFAAKKKVI